MPSRRFSPGSANLDELFGRTAPLLRVPRYQRRFAWNHRQEVTQLWQDLRDAFERSADEYFLGTIVLAPTQQLGVLEIIDGQQRLATLTMILAAIRNKLAPLGTDYADALEASRRLHELIVRTDLRGRPQYEVLTLSQYDQDSFRRYVQLRPGQSGHVAVDAGLPQPRPGRPPTNRVREAFKQIAELVDEWVQGLPAERQIDMLASFAEYVLTRVTHITITVTEDTDAFTLFETVNYRGLDLSVADLLKNHLFGLAKTERSIEELTNLWTSLVTQLEDHEITRFLRYFWLSRHGHATEKDLYPRIKEHIRRSSVDPRDFLSSLNDHAATFATLVTPKDDEPCALDLRDLQAMRMTQGIPFLMAAKEELDETGFRLAVRIVETLSIRNTLVGKRNPNELERRFGEWARQLRDGRSISEIASAARDLMINDDEFEEGFKDLSELSTPQARYLLRKIAWFGDTETQIASAGVDIEHILPQNPSDEWIRYMGGNEEDVRAASKRLGNLTLLSERLNRRAAARPFEEKRDNYYSKSRISITQSLREYPRWTFATITERQARFANLAKQIWSL